MTLTPLSSALAAAALSLPTSDAGMGLLRECYPQIYLQLAHGSFEWAGPDMVGRSHKNATLFLELSVTEGFVRAWIWDVREECYVGHVHKVWGALGPAVEMAVGLVESYHAQDELSGGVPRYFDSLEQEHHAV